MSLKDILPFLLTMQLVLRSLHMPGGRVSVRVFEKCWRLLIKKGMSFVNEISGIASGLVTHGLGDLDFWRGVGT